MSWVDPTGQRNIPVAVAARMRRQETLYDAGKQFEFILTEAALRWPAGDRAVFHPLCRERVGERFGDGRAAPTHQER